VRRRIENSGKSSGEYGSAVRDIVERFDHVPVHPDIFRKRVPTSSVPSHLYLRAVELLQRDGVIAIPEEGEGRSPFHEMMWAVREAFFCDLVDISKRSELDAIAERFEIPTDEVARVIDDGRAFAELTHDALLQRDFKVPVSPALVLDEGRQMLNGNVGYRVIEANIRELLSERPAEMSWC
jgi:hypothetical protein